MSVVDNTAARLAGLRSEFLAGILSWREFTLSAACVYSDAGLPLRAAALTGRERPQHCSESRTCALAMIVRDESANLPALLDSCDLLFDEIIVCDTGSMDDSVDIAMRYGVTIVVHKWEDDFASARNASISAAGTDMIMWLDADDRLPTHSHPRIRELVEKPGPAAFAMRIINTHDGIAAQSFLQARLFPNIDSIRFERRIHEQITPSLEEADIPLFAAPEVIVYHTGYNDASSRAAKARRNKPLIEAEISERANDPALLLSYARCFQNLGQIDPAFAVYHHIASDESFAESAKDIWVHAIISCGDISRKAGRPGDARAWYEAAIAADQTRIDARYSLGRIYRESGRLTDAFAQFHAAASIVPPERMIACDNARVKIEAVHQVIDILLEHKNFTEALVVAEAAAKDNPRVVEFHTMAGQAALALLDYPKAADYFTAAIAMDPLLSDRAREGLAICGTHLADGMPVSFTRD